MISWVVVVVMGIVGGAALAGIILHLRPSPTNEPPDMSVYPTKADPNRIVER